MIVASAVLRGSLVQSTRSREAAESSLVMICRIIHRATIARIPSPPRAWRVQRRLQTFGYRYREWFQLAVELIERRVGVGCRLLGASGRAANLGQKLLVIGVGRCFQGFLSQLSFASKPMVGGQSRSNGQDVHAPRGHWSGYEGLGMSLTCNLRGSAGIFHCDPRRCAPDSLQSSYHRASWGGRASVQHSSSLAAGYVNARGHGR